MNHSKCEKLIQLKKIMFWKKWMKFVWIKHMLKIDWNVSEFGKYELRMLKKENRFDEIFKKRWKVWRNDRNCWKKFWRKFRDERKEFWLNWEVEKRSMKCAKQFERCCWVDQRRKWNFWK